MHKLLVSGLSLVSHLLGASYFAVDGGQTLEDGSRRNNRPRNNYVAYSRATENGIRVKFVRCEHTRRGRVSWPLAC